MKITPYTDPRISRHITKPIRTIVELGCNALSYTQELLEAYKPDILYGFEASPHLHTWIKENTKDPRIKMFFGAVADFDGVVGLYGFSDGSSNEDTLNHSIFQRVHLKERQKTKTFVPATRLDTYFKDAPRTKIDLLCMDIQGAELMALKSLGSMINNVSYIMLELPKKGRSLHGNSAPKYEEFMEFFQKNNFEVVEVLPENDWEDNVLVVKKDTLPIGQPQ